MTPPSTLLKLLPVWPKIKKRIEHEAVRYPSTMRPGKDFFDRRSQHFNLFIGIPREFSRRYSLFNQDQVAGVVKDRGVGMHTADDAGILPGVTGFLAQFTQPSRYRFFA